MEITGTGGTLDDTQINILNVPAKEEARAGLQDANLSVDCLTLKQALNTDDDVACESSGVSNHDANVFDILD